jgi:hypothetical protein
MEKRKKSSAEISTQKNEERKPCSRITFEAFFHKCVFEGKLKVWQHKEIAAFFQDKKLKDKEDLEIYEETLSTY